MVNGLTAALSGKQDTINLSNGITNYLCPQEPLKYNPGFITNELGVSVPITLLELDMTTIYTKAEVNDLLSSYEGGNTFENGIIINGGHLIASGANSRILVDRISHYLANKIIVESELEVNNKIFCDTI